VKGERLKIVIVLFVFLAIFFGIAELGRQAEVNADQINATVASGGKTGIEFPVFSDLMALFEGQ
jgi:hypothetical protein